MTKSEKKFIFASTHAQALHYAKSIMGWARSEWEFLSDPLMLKGLHSIVVYEVRAPKQKMSIGATEAHRAMREAIDEGVASGRIVRLNVVNI
jgi:hypothetical protein